MPANGLIYAPPHPCACYPEAKLYGFVALAAGSPTRAVLDFAGRKPPGTRPGLAEEMNEKGNAPDSHEFGGAEGEGDDAWPTFRADPARSGHTAASLPARLKPAWETMLGGRLTAPVAAEGKLLVASIDTHTIHALDVASGQPVWCYAAGGGSIPRRPFGKAAYCSGRPTARSTACGQATARSCGGSAPRRSTAAWWPSSSSSRYGRCTVRSWSRTAS
jgi:hypothetical protein